MGKKKEKEKGQVIMTATRRQIMTRYFNWKGKKREGNGKLRCGEVRRAEKRGGEKGTGNEEGWNFNR